MSEGREQTSSSRHVIIGIGNPGRQYDNTRHNIGWEVIDRLGQRNAIDITRRKHRAFIGEGRIDGRPVILVKPLTFVNLSGESAREILDYHGLTADCLLVVIDDANLDPGVMRLRRGGSHGGHNGMKSLIQCLGTTQFSRLRIGIGSPPPSVDLIDYVLSRFTRTERPVFDEAVDRAAEAVECFLRDGVETAMNRYNG